MPSTNNLILSLKIRKFRELLEEAMQDELQVAAVKWKNNPSQEEKKNILFHSRLQLEAKIEQIYRKKWRFDSSANNISLAVKKGSGEMEIPSREASASELMLVRAREAWYVMDEDDKDLAKVDVETAVSLESLPEHVMAEVTDWARTAVFYGVGSMRGERK